MVTAALRQGKCPALPPWWEAACCLSVVLGATRLKQLAELVPCLQVYMASDAGDRELFCISAIVGGGPMYTLVLGANFHRAYYTVYEYDAYTDTARVSSRSTSSEPGNEPRTASARECSEGCMPCGALHAADEVLLHARHT